MPVIVCSAQNKETDFLSEKLGNKVSEAPV